MMWLDSVRIALDESPRVNGFIKSHEERFGVLSGGDLARQHGLVAVLHEKMMPILQRIAELTADFERA